MNKRFPFHLVFMAAAEAATATGTPGAAPSTNDASAAPAATKTRAPKNPDNVLNIINGRLPYPLVHLIRFGETGSNADVAKKYGTSVGKVFDIKKGRNFGYIDQAYKPSAEEMTAARAWIETGKTTKGQTLKEAGGDPDGIKAALDKMTVATPEEVSKRGWVIKQVGQKAEGQAPAAAPATGGGTAAPADKPQGAKLF